MKFGYYAPTPWGDFYELRIDTTKVFPAGIDVLDDHDFCFEVLDNRTNLHRIYLNKGVSLNALDKFTVHCPFCDKAMEPIGTVNNLARTALYNCKNCVNTEMED